MKWDAEHPFVLGDYAQREDTPASVERLERQNEALREFVRAVMGELELLKERL